MTSRGSRLRLEELEDRALAALVAIGLPDGSVEIRDTVLDADVVSGFRPLDTLETHYNAPLSVLLADFNGDGVKDLIVAPTATGNGSGLDPRLAGRAFAYDGATLFFTGGSGSIPAFHTFTPFASNADGTTPYSHGLELAAGDVDGDGKPDLVAGTNGDVGMVAAVHVGTAAGGTQDTIIGSVIKNVFGADYTRNVPVTAADFNADGKAEIAVARGGSNVRLESTVQGTTTRGLQDILNGATAARVKMFEVNNAGTGFKQLNLTGKSNGGVPVALKPFAGIVSSTGKIITENATVTFVTDTTTGRPDLVFAALDTVTDPTNPQIRVAVFSIDPTTGLATPVSKGPGVNGSYTEGKGIGSFGISGVPVVGGTGDNIVLAEQGTSMGLAFLDPFTGVPTGKLDATILAGGVRISAV